MDRTPTRRHALAALGATGVGAVAVTAGCSSDDPVGEASSAASSAAGAAGSAASNLVKAAEIPVGGGKVLTLLKVVITQPTEGDFKAFSSICPHQGCQVSSVKDGAIVCPCHGSTFDIATGAVKSGPSKEGLPAKSLSVTADGIKIT